MPAAKRSLTLQGETAVATTPTHPEELRVAVSASANPGRLEVSARCTPAGLVSIGVMVSCILLSVAVVVSAAKARPG